MNAPLKISLDAMGGDNGPETVIGGADRSLTRRPDTEYLLFGDEPTIAPILARYPALEKKSTIYHTDVSVKMDEKPSQALRRGRRNSSMWKAIEAVKNGEADVCISAGNTGALMAMAKLCLRTVADVDRPAIAALWPTIRREGIVLDVGANVGADANQLVDYAVMGAAMARALFSKSRPVIGLLNVGVEEIKGLDEIKKAASILRESEFPFDYHGFVEGDDLGKGLVDVVVTEGFSGNIALKTAEGTAKQVGVYLKDAMTRSWMTKLGAIIASSGFQALKRKMDPRGMNGGVFLGLNGLVIKSHGGTDAKGFASAIDLGYDMASNGLVQRLSADILEFRQSLGTNENKE
jgi:glycerol-3-phosphate acyltransferase PlsX